MYLKWPVIRAGVLVVVGLALLAWSFFGNWFSVSWEELARYLAGIAGIGCMVAAYFEMEEAHNRSVWQARSDRP